MEEQVRHVFPYSIKPIEDSDLNKELLEKFKGERTSFVQVGPEKWFFPFKYKLEAENLYNFKVRKDDIWIVTFPRSGTTWTQEMTWLIANNCDFERARQVPLSKRFPFLEFYVLNHPELIEELEKENCYSEYKLSQTKEMLNSVIDPLEKQEGRRFIKTHLPFSLLPPDLLKKGCKVVYVARNPKDVAVSYYHLHRLMKNLDFKGNFEEFWNYFKNDLVIWSPYWSHVKEGWERKDEDNLLFLFYENINKNLNDAIKALANFLGKSLTPDQLQQLEDHLRFENFKKNTAVNNTLEKDLSLQNPNEGSYIRKGKICNWEGYFTEEINNEADLWIDTNLKLIDMRFPL